ncbi:hypothetical protein OH799_11190 [Nocardia sp. NBC_00881]|uniref:hypothetical protein n=1 Tax=Nocardia sp. NBC_00881 TaxID=2975995 RepID=UPI003868BECD|nr:hypothetical protein OH799_11190 [Nocardia sp. NBC_00881]
MARPKVIIDCVASRYQGPDERIVEISHACGGALISIRATSIGRLVIDLYRLDDTVDVHAPDRGNARTPRPRRNINSRKRRGNS